MRHRGRDCQTSRCRLPAGTIAFARNLLSFVSVGRLTASTVLTASAAIGVDAGDGSLLWRYENVAYRVANIAMPAYADGYVFYSTDDVRAACC
jgi:hypothetical protein